NCTLAFPERHHDKKHHYIDSQQYTVFYFSSLFMELVLKIHKIITESCCKGGDTGINTCKSRSNNSNEKCYGADPAKIIKGEKRIEIVRVYKPAVMKRKFYSLFFCIQVHEHTHSQEKCLCKGDKKAEGQNI